MTSVPSKLSIRDRRHVLPVSVSLLMTVFAGVPVACSNADQGVEASGGEVSAAASVREALLDVNDVSILFPAVGDTENVLPSLGVKEGNLWSESHFKQVIDFAKSIKIVGDDEEPDSFPLREEDRLEAWKVVGMRFDPCSPGLAAVRKDAKQPKETQRFGGTCAVQLRLVAQPGMSDYAAHLIFNLGTVPVDEVAKSPVVRAMTDRLVRIKALGGGVTSGKPLGEHPALKAGGDSEKKTGKALRDLVFDAVKGKVVEGQTLPVTREIAFMGLRGRGEWTFFGGKVDPNTNVWTQTEKLPGHFTSSQSVDQIGLEDIADELKVRPVSEPGPGLAATTTGLFAMRQSVGGSSVRKTPVAKDVDDAYAVENPEIVDLFNTDCVSCHSSSSRLAVAKFGREYPSMSLTGPEIKSRMKVPAFVTGYVAQFGLQLGAWNTRNFGYFEGRRPSISGRTVNETSEIVKFLNEEVLQASTAPEKRLAGPGLACADDEKVALCLLESQSNCFEGCTNAP